MEENSAETASDTGITPPDDIEMDIRNAITDMINPNITISVNLFFFLAISESSCEPRSSFSPLYPFFSEVNSLPFSAIQPLLYNMANPAIVTAATATVRYHDQWANPTDCSACTLSSSVPSPFTSLRQYTAPKSLPV